MLLGTVLALLLLGTGPASAHAALSGTDPDDGSVVQRAPRHVTLTFTESVGLLDDSFRIFGPDQRRVRTGEATHADGRSETARVALPAGLAQGTYTVAWRVVSADSHPVSGAFSFSVGKRSATTAQVDTGPAEDPLTGGLHDAARYLAYLAAALLVGTAAFVLLCRPADPSALRRPARGAWWALLGATVVLLLLRAPYEAGTGPASAFDTDALGRTLTGRPGQALLVRLAVLLLTAALARWLSRGRADGRGPSRGGPVPLAVGTVLAVALALTWAAAEHASAGIQVPLAMTSSVLHLLATGVWLGGLVALLLVSRRGSGEDLERIVPLFSRIAFAAVTVLAVTGLYQSWRGLGSLSALSGTPYGRLLLAKLAGVGALLLVARYARRWAARIAAPARTAETAAVAVRIPQPVGAVVGGPGGDDGPEPEGPPAGPEPPAGSEPAGREGTGGPGGDHGPGARSGPGRTGRLEGPGRAEGPGGPDGAEEPDGPGKADGPDGRHGSCDPHDPHGSGSPGHSAGPAGRDDHEEHDARRRGLRRSVLAEVAVAAVVLFLTTLLTGTLPGRAQAEAARQAPVGALPPTAEVVVPFDTGRDGVTGRGSVYVTLDPARVGDNAVTAVVHGSDTGLVVVPEVRITFTLPSREVGPIDAEVKDRGGYWGTNSVNLPLAGNWTMRTTVRVSDVDQVTVEKKVRIAP
ncbi:copper resistance protein CopC [Streptomyces sp. NPDC055952]|uniref:copper resistance CopC/CopD family protein n=1 Tax=Streptomyces sp. NPDC055952 TaxID=3345663 RepID=UPI0035D83106